MQNNYYTALKPIIIWAYIALVILASTSYSALLCWLLFVLEEDVTEQEGGFYVDIDE